jgi:hypothetical protein
MCRLSVYDGCDTRQSVHEKLKAKNVNPPPRYRSLHHVLFNGWNYAAYLRPSPETIATHTFEIDLQQPPPGCSIPLLCPIVMPQSMFLCCVRSRRPVLSSRKVSVAQSECTKITMPGGSIRDLRKRSSRDLMNEDALRRQLRTPLQATQRNGI